jgi:HEPN domain-containing protein
MNAPDEALVQKVLEWLTYADEDLRLARHGFRLATSCPYRLIAYHAQQCAEKCLKSYLVHHRVDFPYTHNIAKLLEMCGRHANWTQELKDAVGLRPYATLTRYPGEAAPVTRREAFRAVQIAGRVQKVVRKALAKEGMVLPKVSKRRKGRVR